MSGRATRAKNRKKHANALQEADVEGEELCEALADTERGALAEADALLLASGDSLPLADSDAEAEPLELALSSADALGEALPLLEKDARLLASGDSLPLADADALGEALADADADAEEENASSSAADRMVRQSNTRQTRGIVARVRKGPTNLYTSRTNFLRSNSS